MISLRTLVFFASAFLFAACGPALPLPPQAPMAQPVYQPAPETILSQPAPTEPVVVKPKIVRPEFTADGKPIIQAESAIVIDTLTGRILYQKNARTERAVASTQKLLTALCVARAGSLEDPVTIQTSDTQVEPSKIYIKAGESYTRRQLVKALLVKSGNDVANALARDVSGSQAAFTDLMNATARSLGMTQSNFKNAHGLTAPGQYSTAFDIALLAQEAARNPFFRDCMQTHSYLFEFSDGRSKTLTNTNKVLKRLSYCTGMKTGYTRASGRCLVSSGSLNGQSIIAVALGSTTTEIWNDSVKLLRWALE